MKRWKLLCHVNAFSISSRALEDELDKSHFMEQQKYQQSGSFFASRLVEQKAEHGTFFYSNHRLFRPHPTALRASRSSAWCDGREKFSVRRRIYAPTIVYCRVKPTSSSRVASAYVKARYIGSCTAVITSSTKALDEASRCALPWWKLEEEASKKVLVAMYGAHSVSCRGWRLS